MDIWAAGVGLAHAGDKLPDVRLDPEKLQSLQSQYMADALALFQQGFTGATPSADKRFSDASWRENPLAASAAAAYLLNARTLLGLADSVQADPKTTGRIRFAVEQWIAAAAPSNFLAFNA